MASRRKPRVGVIYSVSSKRAIIGENLAVYLGVCLQLGGYADVRVIGFSSETPSTRSVGSPQRKFVVVPYGGSHPTSPNHCECCRDEWKALEECNMVLICVDPSDTEACAKALSSAVKSHDDIAVINFDMGVRNHAAAEKQLSTVASGDEGWVAYAISCDTDEGSSEHVCRIRRKPSLSAYGIGLLSGAVGITVAKSPVDGCLRCLGTGTLVVERLSKKQAKEGVKFINLLRSAGIPIRHCKNVTSYSHGAMVFKTCHAAAALAGLPLRDFLRNRSARLLWAAMIRESLGVLAKVARGGDWKASNPCCPLTLPQLELILSLPTFLFNLVSRLVLRFPSQLAPPMQLDLAQGRETGIAWTLGEVVRIADVHKVSVPACRAVYSAVTLAVRVGNGVPSKTPQAILAEAYGNTPSATTRALMRKVLAWGCAIASVSVILGMIGGPWVVVTGLLVMLFALVLNYVVVGDVVP